MQDAAQELGITPAAISQRVRDLEQRHGQRLFLRTRQGVALTAAGRELYADAAGPLAALGAAKARHFAGRQSRIRLSAAPIFA